MVRESQDNFTKFLIHIALFGFLGTGGVMAVMGAQRTLGTLGLIIGIIIEILEFSLVSVFLMQINRGKVKLWAVSVVGGFAVIAMCLSGGEQAVFLTDHFGRSVEDVSDFSAEIKGEEDYIVKADALLAEKQLKVDEVPKRSTKAIRELREQLGMPGLEQEVIDAQKKIKGLKIESAKSLSKNKTSAFLANSFEACLIIVIVLKLSIIVIIFTKSFPGMFIKEVIIIEKTEKPRPKPEPEEEEAEDTDTDEEEEEEAEVIKMEMPRRQPESLNRRPQRNNNVVDINEFRRFVIRKYAEEQGITIQNLARILKTSEDYAEGVLTGDVREIGSRTFYNFGKNTVGTRDFKDHVKRMEVAYNG